MRNQSRSERYVIRKCKSSLFPDTSTGRYWELRYRCVGIADGDQAAYEVCVPSPGPRSACVLAKSIGRTNGRVIVEIMGIKEDGAT